MKILQINNFHYLRGGSERYYLGVSELLQRNGHEVIHFSMQHPKNLHSDYDNYFVSNIDFEKSARNINLNNGLNVISRTIYFAEAKRKLEKLIETERPDLVHLQNFHHQLSPSILYAAKKFGLPVVWTVHDYEPICPNTLFLNNTGVCEECKGGKYHRAIFNRCKKGSLAASVMAALTFCVHRTMRIYELIDIFITPSNFMRNKLIAYGFNGDKIVHVPNFIDCEEIAPSYEHSDYFLYIGRLSKEKGIATLLKAVGKLDIDIQLKLVGDGPLEEETANYIARNKLEKTIQMLGYRGGKELKEIIKKAMFIILPSECYENFPYAVLEAFAYGKPVIGSHIGGIPEQVDEGTNGCLFEPRNADALRQKIAFLIENPAKIINMGKKAREKAELQYNSKQHYVALNKIYQRLL